MFLWRWRLGEDFRPDFMAASRVLRQIDDITWYSAERGGFITILNENDPDNRVMVHISGFGLTIADGLKKHTIMAPDFTYRTPKRGENFLAKFWREKIRRKPRPEPELVKELKEDRLQEVLNAIYSAAAKQVVGRINDGSWHEKNRDDLFRKLGMF